MAETKTTEAAAKKPQQAPADVIAEAALAKATATREGHPLAVPTYGVPPSPLQGKMMAGAMDNVAAGVRFLTDFLANRFGDDLEALVKRPEVLDFLSTWVSRKALDLADGLIDIARHPQVIGGDDGR